MNKDKKQQRENQLEQFLTLQNLLRANPFNEQFANKKTNQIKKNYYKGNQIFNKYFNIAANLKIINKTIIFQPQAPIFQNRRLNKEKQLMYARNFIDKNTISDSLVQQLLQQAKKQKGFIKNRRQRSLIIKNHLIYVHEWSLFKLDLNFIHHQQKGFLSIKLFEWKGDQILGIQQYKHNSIEGCNLLIRFARHIILFSIQSQSIIKEFVSEGQFIQMKSQKNQRQFQVLQYLDNQTILLKFQDQKGNQKHFFSKLVHSFQTISKNQRIFAHYQGFFIKDLRKKKDESLYEIQSITKQRIYNFMHLKGNLSYSPILAVVQTQEVSFFDIRKTNKCLQKVPHISEKAPPFIMSYNQQSCISFNQKRQIKPFLLCYSPHQMGVSLMLNLDNKLQFNSKSTDYYFRILPQSSNCHNDSVNFLLNKDQISVNIFLVNKAGGVSYQQLFYDQQSLSYKLFPQKLSEKVMRNKQNFEQKNFKLQWFQNQYTQKYFLNKQQQQMDENLSQFQQEDEKQNQCYKLNKRVNYANLSKFHKQVVKKSKTCNFYNQQYQSQLLQQGLNTLDTLNNMSQAKNSQNNQKQQTNPLSLLKQNLLDYKLFFQLKSLWQKSNF